MSVLLVDWERSLSLRYIMICIIKGMAGNINTYLNDVGFIDMVSYIIN